MEWTAILVFSPTTVMKDASFSADRKYCISAICMNEFPSAINFEYLEFSCGKRI